MPKNDALEVNECKKIVEFFCTLRPLQLRLCSSDAGTFLKTVKNVTDRSPVHTKTAHFLPVYLKTEL